MQSRLRVACLLTLSTITASGMGGAANRLVYLDDPCDPYYVHQSFRGW